MANKLILIASFLLVSCASCRRFDWQIHAWSGDHENQQIVDANGVTVKCDQPDFSTYTCLGPENLADLIAEIKKINGLNKKQLNQIDGAFKALKKSNPLYQLPDFVGGY